MRKLLQKQPLPECLEKKNLEPYYVVQEIDDSGEDEEEDPQQSTSTSAAKETEPDPPEQPVKRSLLLGRSKSLPQTGASAADPLVLSSPEPEIFPLQYTGDDDVEEEDPFSPPSQLDLLAQEIRATKEQQQKDQARVEQMFLSLHSAFQGWPAQPAPARTRQQLSLRQSTPHR